MKKLFYGALAALMLTGAACSNNADETSAKYFSKEATDSLLMSLGNVAGSDFNMRFAMDTTLSKDLFMKGVQYGMASDSAQAYLQGVMVGLQLQNALSQYAAMGLDANKGVLLDYFKTALMADSVPDQFTMSVMQAEYRHWVDSLQNAKHHYDIAVLAASPEAKENAAKGENYIKAQAAENDSVKVTASGLGYKIVDAGTGDKVNVGGRAIVKYTGKTLNGVMVDRVNGMPIAVASRTEGLKEGLSMLGKGGKAVFYVPGNLAYGVEIPAGMPIGPNELVIYEVEVVDVPTASNIPAPAAMQR